MQLDKELMNVDSLRKEMDKEKANTAKLLAGDKEKSQMFRDIQQQKEDIAKLMEQQKEDLNQ